MVSIRGATTIEKDNSEELLFGTRVLLQNIIEDNKLKLDFINAIFFTCTTDLVSAYPAKAARDLGINHAALMCMQEMHVEKSLEKCIRVCIFYDDDNIKNDIKHIYLNRAQSLRPDLIK